MINLLQQSLLRWLQISEFWVDALLGGLILLAVLIDFVVMKQLRALWARGGMREQTSLVDSAVKEENHVA